MQKNEADDQYAIVHALLTPKFDVKGLIGAHYGSRQYADSMNRSYEECRKLVSMLKKTQEVPVYRGASEAVKDEGCFEYSEGAKAIVEECMAEDEKAFVCRFYRTDYGSCLCVAGTSGDCRKDDGDLDRRGCVSRRRAGV